MALKCGEGSAIVALIIGLTRKLHESWLGPLFWYDLIRLARKGWPTLARVAFLVIVLVSMLIMNRTQGDSVGHTMPAELARRADNFATLLLVLQTLLVLAILPVYVATAIVEEKENQTLEALTLTQLSDRELVLGKLGARLLHVGAFALAVFPLLAFMHLWGNVAAATLIYHEILVFLLLVSAGSVCMWVSTTSESVFQAISHAYGLLAVMGVASLLAAFGMPWICTLPTRNGEPSYWIALPIIAAPHVILAGVAVSDAIRRVEYLRREERRKPRKLTAALTMTDGQPVSTKVGKRGQTKSRIHPLAWPIGDNALFWKECLKDGTTYSLSIRWLGMGLASVVVAAMLFQLVHILFSEPGNNARGIAIPLTLSAYFIGLIAYTIVVVFQLTMTVASEREQGTMIFLLMLPVERREIFFAKWLGPWWRNWPILAVCYLGVLLGFGSGLYGVGGALVMALLPWPFLLLLGASAFGLSVVCRRVLFANIAVVSVLGVLVIAHIAWGESAWHALAFFLAIITASSLGSWGVLADWHEVAPLAFGQQAAFLAVAALALGHAYWMFRRKDYSS